MLVNKRIFQFGIFFVLMILLALTTQSVLAAPIDKFPVTVTQPDGTQLNLFVSGDEFYNWLQDAQGFTVIQDPLTGYYVYANLVKGKLVATRFIVGQANPEAMGLRPYINISQTQMENIRQKSPLRTTIQTANTIGNAPQTPSEQKLDRLPDQARKNGEALDTNLLIAQNQQNGIVAGQIGGQVTSSISNAPVSGVMNNLVIFIRFSDESEFTNATSTYTDMLNNPTGGANSLRNYFQEVSYNALTIDSILFPTPGITVVSYQDIHPRSYYQPYNAVTNPGGYITDRTSREHTLLRDAVNYINSLGQFPIGSSIDGDGDGFVDSVTFIVSGGSDGWSDLLWPHMWSLFTHTVTINGKRVGEYSFQLNAWLDNGVLAHEMFHVLGSPDLYHYSSNGIQPVGGWDVMEYNADPPQHMGCYMKFMYGGWINDIPELATPGTYSLNPLTSSNNNCYKIASPYSATEFFVLEYRNASGSTFESSLPGTGLLVYRINTLTTGNAGGPPDEVYIYRPGGTTTLNGNVNTAHFSNNVGRTSINDATNPSSFLSDGGLGGLNICNVGSSNETISFDICASSVISISGNAGVAGAVLSYTDGGPKTATSNADGFYTFVVPSGWSGTVTPAMEGMSFTPSSRSYTNVLASQTAQDYTAIGGPDVFGYTWDDTVPMNWIDVTDGTDTGLTGYATATGAITIPFSFKYYENTYNQVYIAAPGYLSFSNQYYWDTQSSMQDPNVPNNVVAPYWSPNYIGPESWVRYKSGGAAPNRYFVIEWHDVKGGDPGSSVGSDDTFRYETILHENGDIVFQYQAMTVNGSWWCSSSGIEDSAGLDGLSSASYCNFPNQSFSAVRFYRPPASARLRLDPMQQGSFTAPGEAASYQIKVINQGELGSDVFDLTMSTTWPVTLYSNDGITLLTDTDSDGKVDTGSLPEGAIVTIIAKVATPIDAKLGDANSAAITAVSSLDIEKRKTAILQSAIPAPFAQVYEDDMNGAMSIALNQPDAQFVKKATADYYYGFGTAVAAIPNGNFVYVWSKWRNIGSASVVEIEYSLLDHLGDTVLAPSKLTNHSGAVITTYDYDPSIAIAPDGTIGVIWYRYLYDSTTFQRNYNVFFAILDGAGNLTSGPTNLTNNEVWGSSSPSFYSPSVAASDDNHFILSWEKYLGSPSYTDNIWYAVVDTSGGNVFPPTALTSNNNSYSPILNSLSNGKTILTWLNSGAPTYAVVNSNGAVFKPATVLAASDFNYGTPDAVFLPNGKVATAWATGSGIQYAILNSAYTLESGPFSANNPLPSSSSALSITSDASNRLIMTWCDGTTDKNLFYALSDNTGVLITPPMIYKTSASYIESSFNGQGNAPLVTKVLSIVRANPSPSNLAVVDFTVTFSGSVTGVDTTAPFNDFSLTTSGITGASILGVTPISGTTYTVSIFTGTGSGTIQLNVVDDNSILDAASNKLGGTALGDGNFDTSEVYTVDKILPSVLSSIRLSASLTNLNSIGFIVTFSEPVTGVNTSDFSLTTTGVSGASITSVSGSGMAYIVSVNTGTGSGTIRLNVIDDNSILDTAANMLGGAALGDGSFTTGDEYTIDKTLPLVSSSVRVNASPTNLANVDFAVTFSEPVTGVGASDFSLTTTGVSGAAIISVTGSGMTYIVTVNTGIGSGTILLTVVDDNSILDAVSNQLGGAALGDGSFIIGEMYTVDETLPSVISSVRVSASPSNQASVGFSVTFSEAVTGVDAGDFSLTTTGVSGATITSVVGSGTSYTVIVTTGTGNGTIRLNVVDNNSILDAVSNQLGGAALGDGAYTTGEVYTIDKAFPSVSSVVRVNASPSNLATVDFTVIFSEAITGVDTGDFSLTTTGVSGASVSTVSGSGTTYTVNVNTGTGNGTIRLNVVDNNSIVDAATNKLGGAAAGDGAFTTGQVYSIIKSATFSDTPLTYWANGYIERLYFAGITSGCTTVPFNYCPDNTVNRAQMAVFLLKGIHGSSYLPPAVGTDTGFADVPTSHWAAAWIKQLAAEGITSGCGGGNYCPGNTVTRAQMAVFLLKAKHGVSYVPPIATGVFPDAVGHWAVNWIEQLYNESITSGCAGGNYCPQNPVTRAQMAVFLVKTFNLP